MVVLSEILEKSAREAEKFKSTEVKKHLDVEYDIGTLYAFDKNELDGRELR